MKKNEPYNPPFSINSGIIHLVASIGEGLGRLSMQPDLTKALRLRRINRIRTIRGSLAIEGNTLTEEQITAILDGKQVLAKPREIREVQNAIAAYDRFQHWQPGLESDLLEAHRILMDGLMKEPGKYRSGGVGIMNGEKVIHMAPQAHRVPVLMRDLLHWVTNTNQHPLVSSSVFHYEFEFIHPFSDGNGRMGRLWQTLMLTNWNPIFANIPVESLIHENQMEYYQVLQKSTREADSSSFIEFLLRMIEGAVSSITPQAAPHVTPQVERLMLALVGEMSRDKLQEEMGILDRKSFRESYLKPALANGLIEMTLPDKPNSPLQRYRLTDKARQKSED